MVFQKELTLHSHSSGEMHDLTDAVARLVSESGVRTGIVQIFNVGSTAAIGAIEFELGRPWRLSSDHRGEQQGRIPCDLPHF